MTLALAMKFEQDKKTRVLLAADSLASYVDGRTDLEKKINENPTGIIYALTGDQSAQTDFIKKTEAYIKQCNSLKDVYDLLKSRFKRSFKDAEFSVILIHYKSSEILVYEPPPEMVLRFEKKYVLIGSAAELVHADFNRVYFDQDWRDRFPNFEQALELCLDSFCKAISDQRGAVGLPIDIYLTDPPEYFKISKTDDIWVETEKRVSEKLELKGIKSKLPEIKKLEFKPYEKKPEAKQVASTASGISVQT